MEQVGIAPKRTTMEAPATDNWLRVATSRFNIYTSSANPTAAEVPEGQWVLHVNTSTNTMRLWGKYNGTLKSVTLT